MNKLNDFIGKTLNRHQALIAQSIIGKRDEDNLNETSFEDDPEDGWGADYSGDAFTLADDVKCFRKIIMSKNKQFKVSPKHDMVVNLKAYFYLLHKLYQYYIHELSDLKFDLADYVHDYHVMQNKHHKTSKMVSNDRSVLIDSLYTFDIKHAPIYEPSLIIKVLTNLHATLKIKKAQNVKTNLTANDIAPYIEQIEKLIKKLSAY